MAYELAKLAVESGAYINNWSNRNAWVKLPDGSEVPAYLSCRRLISVPAAKLIIKDALGERANDIFSDTATSVIGLATAGIVWGDAIAERMSLPFGYVRGEKKAHGVGRLVECNPPENTKALLVDDVLLTGTSFMVAKEALRTEKEIDVAGAITVASLYPGRPSDFSVQLGAPVTSLVNYDELCGAALDIGLFEEWQHEQMIGYYSNPHNHTFRESVNDLS